MDAYIHAVLVERIPLALAEANIPNAMAELLPIKNGNNFKAAYLILSSANTAMILTSRLQDQTLQYVSYQDPEKIIAGYILIGHIGVFDEVANLWPGPATNTDEIKRRLAAYVKRRNQIAHEGDYESSGSVRQMQPKYANDCTDFITKTTFHKGLMQQPYR